MLRKRLPPLEELRMDEEVATYTSVTVSTLPGLLPPRPRCGNPLASILHFEESSVSTLLTLCMYKKYYFYVKIPFRIGLNVFIDQLSNCFINNLYERTSDQQKSPELIMMSSDKIIFPI